MPPPTRRWTRRRATLPLPSPSTATVPARWLLPPRPAGVRSSTSPPTTCSTAASRTPTSRPTRPTRSMSMAGPSSPARRPLRGQRAARHPAHGLGLLRPRPQFSQDHAAARARARRVARRRRPAGHADLCPSPRRCCSRHRRKSCPRQAAARALGHISRHGSRGDDLGRLCRRHRGGRGAARRAAGARGSDIDIAIPHAGAAPGQLPPRLQQAAAGLRPCAFRPGSRACGTALHELHRISEPRH